MKRFSLLLVAMIIVTAAFAQKPGGRGQNGERPKIGKLSGQVIDKENGNPMEYVTIALFNQRDSSLVTGGTTDKRGDFYIESIPIGMYRIRLDFLGYEARFIDSVRFGPRKPEVNLGKVRLTAGASTLAEAQVTGERKWVENKIDRKVYNVEKNIFGDGGTASEILAKIPSVMVDIDGNISLRGSSNLKILIDGKPSSLIGLEPGEVLEQIPAENIQSIEIITNPSAKYEPDGVAGIINIILKKEKQKGLRGSVNLSAGYPQRFSGALNLSYRTGKFNIYGSYSLRNHKREGTSEIIRTNLYGDSTSVLETYGDRGGNGYFHMAKAGIDFTPNRRNSIGFSVLYSLRDFTRKETLNYFEYDGVGSLFQKNRNYSEMLIGGGGFDYSLTYDRKFRKKDHELYAELIYAVGDRSYKQDLDYSYLFLAQDTILYPSEIEKLTYSSEKANIRFRLDYEQPLFGVWKVETGFQSKYKVNESNSDGEDFNILTNLYEYDSIHYSQFKLIENINSVYGILSRNLGFINVKAGLRLEMAKTIGEQELIDSSFTKTYFSFFPSLHLSKKIKEKNEIMASYSRRIHRPSGRSLNPFTIYLDPLNLRKGNPDLNPEYTHSMELSYTRYWGKQTAGVSVFYKHTTDVIQKYQYLLNDSIIVSTSENIASSTSYGFELSSSGNITKFWDYNLSFSFYQNFIDGSNIEENLNNAMMSWSTRAMTGFKLPWKTSMQISGFYRGPGATAQGSYNGFGGVDIGFRKSILKNKGSVSLRFSDIFNTRQWGSKTETLFYTSEYTSQRTSRYIIASFSYRFGKNDVKYDKKKRSNGENGQGDDLIFD